MLDDKPDTLKELNSASVDAELDAAAQLQLDAAAEELAEASDVFDEDFLFKIKPDSRRNERIIAFCLVYAADRFDYQTPLDALIQDLRDGYALEVSHNTFLMPLVQGTIDARDHFDEQMRPYLKNWKLERLGCCTRLIIRMALWELEQPEAIPSIIINEAIELAKLFAERDAYKFVNGILDEVVKSSLPQKVDGIE